MRVGILGVVFVAFVLEGLGRWSIATLRTVSFRSVPIQCVAIQIQKLKH